MHKKKSSVLVVDDEQFNLDIIEEFLIDADIEAVCVDGGEQALSILNETPHRFSAVLLDRMMPGIDGIEVLSKIKADKKLNRLPVIMQTAKGGQQHMVEGLTAGAHYYLTKPYDQKTLIAIVNTAVRDYQNYLHIQDSLKETAETLKMMDKGQFTFKSLHESRNLAALLANACPDSERVVLGLTELMTNAVEHGNLGIGYEEKSKLNILGEWENEIERRLSSSLYKDKVVNIEFSRNDTEITFLITDQGPGFDWNEYMEISPERAFDSHGRGIAMANSMSFDQIEYLDTGNKVRATVPL